MRYLSSLLRRDRVNHHFYTLLEDKKITSSSSYQHPMLSVTLRRYVVFLLCSVSLQTQTKSGPNPLISHFLSKTKLNQTKTGDSPSLSLSLKPYRKWAQSIDNLISFSKSKQKVDMTHINLQTQTKSGHSSVISLLFSSFCSLSLSNQCFFFCQWVLTTPRAMS